MATYTPRFNRQSAIPDLLAQIDSARWLIENRLLMPLHETWFRREIAVRRASATTRIEGAQLDEDAVSRLAKDGSSAGLNEDEQANVGALRAYEFVDYVSGLGDQPLDALVIREINRQMLLGGSETLTPGVFRNGQNMVGTKFAPPSHGDVPELMRALTTWVNGEGSAEHPVVLAGLAHLQFVAIHPFWDGNGRTARAISTLILQRSTHHFRRLLSAEAALWDVRDHYFTAIEQSLGDRYADGCDATPFIELFAGVVLLEVQGLQRRLTDWHRRVENVQRSAGAAGLRRRQVEGLLYASRVGKMTRAEYIELTQVSPVTASRDLAELAARGFLRYEGETRSRVYFWMEKIADDQ